MKTHLEDIRQHNFGMASSSNSQSNHVLPEKKRRVRDSSGSRNVYDSVKNFKSPVQHKTAFDGLSDRNDFEPQITITPQNAQSQRGSKRKSVEQSKAELLQIERMKKKQEEVFLLLNLVFFFLNFNFSLQERIQRELKEKQEEERKVSFMIKLLKRDEF